LPKGVEISAIGYCYGADKGAFFAAGATAEAKLLIVGNC